MSIGTLTVKANERVQQLGSVKQQLFEFLDKVLSPEASEAKKSRFASINKPNNDFLQIYSGQKDDAGLVIDHAEPALSLVPGAKVLTFINEAKTAELQSTFSTLVADLGSRNPVVKTREAQSAVASALVILSMQPGEAIETATQMASLRAGAKNLISSLIIKDPSENGKSSLDAAFRGDARKILIADNQTDFMEAVTAFAKRARLQKLDMDSPEFQAKLSIELGGGFSGVTLANMTINRVKELLATDPQVTAEKIEENFPNNALMSKAMEAFQNEQIEQFKTGVIRSSYDRETNSKTLKYSEAGAEMQAVLNDKIHAWEGIIRATHNTASDGVDEITKLMQAYSRGLQYKTKVINLRDASASEVSTLESFNKSTSTDSTVDIEVRKEYLDFNAKQAILFRLVENNFDAVAMANASKKTISEDDAKSYLINLIDNASGDTVNYKTGNGSSISFSKVELQKIIDLDLTSPVSYKLNGADQQGPVDGLFQFIRNDLQYKEDVKLQESLKGTNETLNLLTTFGGTDAASTNAAVISLNETQLNTMFDQLGVFNLTLKAEDKVSTAGVNSFVTTLEKSYRTKNAELAGLAAYVHQMSAKADSILGVALEKNPSAVNKLFNLYSEKGDNNLLDMLAEHNVRGLAYETYKATIAGTQADEVLLKSNSAYETNLQSLLKSLNENNQYYFNGSASISSIDFKTCKEELETVLPEAKKNELNKRLEERLHSASQYPISANLIQNMAMKEFLFSAQEAIARESTIDPTVKAKYAGFSPTKEQQETFLHNFNELMLKLDHHHESKDGQLALRSQFQEEMSPDTVAYRVLIANPNNAFEQKEAEAKNLFTGILQDIFKPIMDTFFAVNTKNSKVLENFGTAFETSGRGLTELVKVALNGLLPQNYQESGNP
jgi:hypothetical protein